MITNLWNLYRNNFHTQELKTYVLHNPEQVKPFLAYRQEGVFGIEYCIDNKLDKMYFFADHLIKMDLYPSIPIVFDYNNNKISCCNIVFQKPYYLPFSFKYDCNIWKIINKYAKDIMKEKEKVFIQVLFKHITSNEWKHTAIEQYNCYLDGIESPAANQSVRKLQYKLKHLYPNLTNKPNHIEESIQKINEDGFSICIRLVINSEQNRRKRILDMIMLALNTQRYVNGWKAVEITNTKHFLQNIQSRTFFKNNQVMCVSEVNSFFCNNQQSVNNTELEPDLNQPPKQKQNIETRLNPTDDMGIVDAENEIINDLSLAMKRLGLLKEDKLNIIDIKDGLSFKTISFERPKHLYIDQIRKKVEDLEIEMNIKGITIEQGDKKGSIFIMIPKTNREYITLESMMGRDDFRQYSQMAELPIITGVSMSGEPLYYDITKLVHILIAGATGNGKSVFLNSILLSLILNVSPDHLHLYLIDPKRVELNDYKDIPHVKNLITDSRKAASILNIIIDEMESRYITMEKKGVKNIQQYNRKYPNNKWAYKIIVIDEFADLMMIDNSVEDFIQRLGQMARASGIHLIIATQRPSINVITGVIKANMITRVGFACESHHDYKTIFDYMIPYRLIGKGDGVIKWQGNESQFVRFQSPYNDDEDIFQKVIDKWGKREDHIYDDNNPDVEATEEAEDEKLTLLKRTICKTGETRISELQKLTKIRSNTISELMNILVMEGWLEQPQSRKKGYSLLLTDEDRKNYLEQN